jgi:amino acid adenylation domain-containing protein
MRPPIDHCGPVDRPFEPFPYSALEGSIIDRFEAIAKRFTTRVALSDRVSQLTYGGLADLVSRIAADIAVAVADRPGPVAIVLPRNVFFPAAMLGVLAAGRGYVPLDAGDPLERIQLIATQSGAAAVISAGDLARRARSLFSQDLSVLDIETIGDAVCRHPRPRLAPDDLAFIAYTSGSSGRPKGAYHNHRNLLHDVLQQTNTLHLNAEDRVALLYSPAVIAAVREIFMTLLNGASLHILPPQQLQSAGLVWEIRARGITICRTVPVLLRRMTEGLGPNERLDSVRVVGLGSQRVDWNDFDVFRRHFPSEAFLIVGIGSTECGGNYCHWFVDDQLRATGPRLPIGRMLPDASVTITGDDGRPVAIGQIGEFVVASRYLALGYWRDPDLTARAFTVDPGDPKTRIFKTGDMGRMRPDGLLEYVGRSDQQIKLRGHRIEIGEIELALGECAGVEDAAVVVRRDETGQPGSLAAYVELSSDAGELLPRDLLSMLSKRLPDYMVPATLHVVKQLPRLPHLKIDRVRLAELDRASEAELFDYRHGKTSKSVALLRVKKIIAANIPTSVRLWHRIKKMPAAMFDPPEVDRLIHEILGIFERVIEMKGLDANDNVASAGGDSMHAVILANEIERKYQVVLPAGFVEERHTIRELARWIDAQRRRSPVEHENAEPRERILTSTYASRVGEVLDILSRLPGKDTALPFEDDRTKDVQIVKHDRAQTVLLLFCEDYHQLGLPLPRMHGWFGRLNASLIYLRDFRRCYYLHGVSSLGASRLATLAELRRIITSLGAERVLCFGVSAGVFAALSYGLDLKAEAVLCMGGATSLSPEFKARMATQQRIIASQTGISNIELDLRRLYANALQPPRVHLVYGQDFWLDRCHAEHMAGLPSITLQPVENCDVHNVVLDLIGREQFEEVLQWLMRPAAGTTSARKAADARRP